MSHRLQIGALCSDVIFVVPWGGHLQCKFYTVFSDHFTVTVVALRRATVANLHAIASIRFQLNEATRRWPFLSRAKQEDMRKWSEKVPIRNIIWAHWCHVEWEKRWSIETNVWMRSIGFARQQVNLVSYWSVWVELRISFLRIRTIRCV